MPEYVVLRESTPPEVDGRTITARIATYGRIYTPTPTLRERVVRGAFKSPLNRPGGVLRYRHNGERPGETDSLADVFGVVTGLHEDGDAVLADLEVFPGPDGDKILRLVEKRGVTGVSMAAVVAESAKGPDGVLSITRISSLNGVSLTPQPAYDDAQVLALREARQAQAAAAAQARADIAALRASLPPELWR